MQQPKKKKEDDWIEYQNIPGNFRSSYEIDSLEASKFENFICQFAFRARKYEIICDKVTFSWANELSCITENWIVFHMCIFCCCSWLYKELRNHYLKTLHEQHTKKCHRTCNAMELKGSARFVYIFAFYFTRS